VPGHRRQQPLDLADRMVIAVLDERIVQRAHRQQPFAVDLMRKAKGGQHGEQVHLGDAQFQMLALRREPPVERRRSAFGAEHIRHLLAREQAPAVHPPAEVGGHGDVRRGGDDAPGQFAVAFGQFMHQQPEAMLRGHPGRGRWRQRFRYRNDFCRGATCAARVEWHGTKERSRR
jgi:hypothetical protein